MGFEDIRAYLGDKAYIGYAPSNPEIDDVMEKFAKILRIRMYLPDSAEKSFRANHDHYSVFKAHACNFLTEHNSSLTPSARIT